MFHNDARQHFLSSLPPQIQDLTYVISVLQNAVNTAEAQVAKSNAQAEAARAQAAVAKQECSQVFAARDAAVAESKELALSLEKSRLDRQRLQAALANMRRELVETREVISKALPWPDKKKQVYIVFLLRI